MLSPSLVPDSRIHIVCATDGAYAMPTAVMAASVASSATSGRHISLHVLDGGMTPSIQKRLGRALARTSASAARRHVTFESVRHTPDLRVVAGLDDHGHVSTTSYLRLVIPDVLPHVDRAMWIDADTLVCRDLAGLGLPALQGGIDLGGAPAAAAVNGESDMPTLAKGLPRHAERSGLPLDPQSPYVNAGVLVLDLAAWRKNRIGEAVLEDLRAHQSLYRYWEQDGLNAVLAGRWVILPPEWNVLLGSLDVRHRRTAPADVGVLHFCATPKPWRGGFALTYPAFYAGYQRAWLHAARRSGWFSEGQWATFRAWLALRDHRLVVRRALAGV